MTGQVFTQCRSLYLECAVHARVHLCCCTNHYFYIIVGLSELERAAHKCRLTHVSAQFSIFQLLVLLLLPTALCLIQPHFSFGDPVWANVGKGQFFCAVSLCWALFRKEK